MPSSRIIRFVQIKERTNTDLCFFYPLIFLRILSSLSPYNLLVRHPSSDAMLNCSSCYKVRDRLPSSRLLSFSFYANQALCCVLHLESINLVPIWVSPIPRSDHAVPGIQSISSHQMTAGAQKKSHFSSSSLFLYVQISLVIVEYLLKM